MSGTAVARVPYVPLERRRGGEYAARRALFLQSYRFSFSADGRPEQGLRAAVARAVARAWRGWRPRARLTLLRCFGPGHRRHKVYLQHDYA